MTREPKEIYNSLLEKEANRLRGELSSKTGKDYEDLSSFYILERFHNILKFKSKITKICFNGLEDLDIFDDQNRIFSFQIKKNRTVWDKSDKRLVDFILRCVKRFLKIKNEEVDVNYYFYTNKTGKFFDKWNAIYKKEPLKAFELFTNKIKNYIKKRLDSDEKIINFIRKLNFLVDRKENYMLTFIEEDLLNKFKKVKAQYEPGDIIEFKDFNEAIFYDKRLMFSKIDEPKKEQDILVSNTMELKINVNKIYYAEKKKSLSNKNINEVLKESPLKISYFAKYGNIYSFRELNKRNPLTKFCKTSSQVAEIKFTDLEDKDQVYFLNYWLYNFLLNLGLRFHKKKNKRLFYFYAYNEGKTIKWYDPNSKSIKNWDVVKNRGNFYSNVAAEIRVTKFSDIFFVVINPRYLFSNDGAHLLSAQEINYIERKFRKSFMKNDFLRRWLYVFVSYIQQKEKQTDQIKMDSFLTSQAITKKKRYKFLDKSMVSIGEPISITAQFRPNKEET